MTYSTKLRTAVQKKVFLVLPCSTFDASVSCKLLQLGIIRLARGLVSVTNFLGNVAVSSAPSGRVRGGFRPEDF